MKSSKIMIIAAGILLVAGLTSCSKKSGTASAANGNQTQKVVRINFSTGSLCHAPVHVAMKLGLFDEELEKIGQKAEYVQVVEGGATLGEMIASGKVDAGYGLYATQLQAMDTMFVQIATFILQQIYVEKRLAFQDLPTVQL